VNVKNSRRGQSAKVTIPCTHQIGKMSITTHCRAKTHGGLGKHPAAMRLRKQHRIWDNDGVTPNLAGQAIARAIRALAASDTMSDGDKS